MQSVGLFAPEPLRTASVKCLTDCRVYEVSGGRAKELFFQNRQFGFAMLQLIIGRMLENAERSQEPASGNIVKAAVISHFFF